MTGRGGTGIMTSPGESTISGRVLLRSLGFQASTDIGITHLRLLSTLLILIIIILRTEEVLLLSTLRIPLTILTIIPHLPLTTEAITRISSRRASTSRHEWRIPCKYVFLGWKQNSEGAWSSEFGGDEEQVLQTLIIMWGYSPYYLQ